MMNNGNASDAAGAALTTHDLQVSYGPVQALHGVNIELQAGKIVTVIGPNGAGKSTLLNAIMGLLPDNGLATGRVEYGGHPIHHESVEQRLDRGIALVPERRELFSSMTVQDNLELGAYRRRDARKSRTECMEEIFQLFPRLKERRKQAAGTLSGGERQMLALGRALMSAPHVLLLDEPSLGLAPRVMADVFEIIARLRETGVATLLIEQNSRAALKVADYGYVLELGHITLQGPASALATNPQVVAAYLGASHAQPKETTI
jgi:branched-chain amino acid transport system ATP-binding protein